MRHLSLPLALLSLAACTVYDPLYCESNAGCTDPARPFCDVSGDYPASEGVARTCIPSPLDAGTDDGGDDGGGSAADGGAETDAARSDAADPCSWGRFTRLANVNSDDNDVVGSLSSDGSALYFARYDEQVAGGIYVASRASLSEVFGKPALIQELSDEGAWENYPEVSSSGLEIFYVVDFSGVQTATRTSPSGVFGPSQPAGIAGLSPSLSGDGLAAYFIRLVAGSGGVVHRSTRARVGAPWSAPATVLPGGGYNSVDVSPDELRLLLTSQDDEAPILIAERASTDVEFGSPVPLSEAILVPGAGTYLSAKWDATQTQMVASPTVSDGGLEMFYSVCE